MRGEGIQIPLKAGHHHPASETPFKWHSLAGRCRPNIECWLDSFVNLQGIRASIAKRPYSFVIFQDPLPPSGSARGILHVFFGLWNAQSVLSITVRLVHVKRGATTFVIRAMKYFGSTRFMINYMYFVNRKITISYKCSHDMPKPTK